MNERFIDDNHASTYVEMSPGILTYSNVGSYWNNMQHIYDDVSYAF